MLSFLLVTVHYHFPFFLIDQLALTVHHPTVVLTCGAHFILHPVLLRIQADVYLLRGCGHSDRLCPDNTFEPPDPSLSADFTCGTGHLKIGHSRQHLLLTHHMIGQEKLIPAQPGRKPLLP